MLLRVRVALPDRPGSLGQVARTLGVAGADIVQVVVLERSGGRAVDDFTVVWPGGAGVARLTAGLAAIPGVRVDGVWHAEGSPVWGGYDAELLSQIAVRPQRGLATLVDAAPMLLAADWAAALVVSADWAHADAAQAHPAQTHGTDPVPSSAAADPGEDVPGTDRPKIVYASWRMPQGLRLPWITPLRSRALTDSAGTRYAVCPFGRAGLVLLLARAAGDELPVSAFHRTELDRLSQLVRATTAVLGSRLEQGLSPAGEPVVAG